MKDHTLTRRHFTSLAAAAAAAQVLDLHGAHASESKLSAGELVRRISSASGVTTLPDRPVDGFKAGSESTAVRGIAVTSMATMDVLRKASDAKLNLVLSFEPTFFGRDDGQPPPANAGGPGGGPNRASLAPDDPVLMAKRKFIESNGLVVYRLHDQWAGRQQNEHARALAAAMGWTNSIGGSATEYQITPASLSSIVAQARSKLKTNGGVRVIGDPNARIQRVTVLPGTQVLTTLLATMPKTELILAGEIRDWEGAEYLTDAVSAGMNKSVITVGKVVAGDPGMRACADWIKTLITKDVKDVPVQWIAAGEPFWRPA